MTDFYKQPNLPSKKKRVRINEEKFLALQNGAKPTKGGKGGILKPIPGEEWKPLIGKGNQIVPNYFVSNLGRAKKVIPLKTGEEKVLELLGRTIPDGMKNIEGFGSLPRAVAKAFIPIDNYDELVVLHKDCDKSNASSDNLIWGTLKEAFEHKKKCGQHNQYLKTKNIINARTGETQERKVAFSDKDVAEIRRLRKLGYTQSKISQIIGCSQSYVAVVTKNKGFRKTKNENLKPDDQG